MKVIDDEIFENVLMVFRDYCYKKVPTLNYVPPFIKQFDEFMEDYNYDNNIKTKKMNNEKNIMNCYSRKSIEEVLNHLGEYAEELLTDDRNSIYAHQFINQYDYVKHKYLKEGVDELLNKEEQKQIEQLKGQNQACYYEKAENNIYRPSHYGKFTPIDAIASGLFDEKELKGYLKGNVLKYLTRYESKNGVEDLDKASEYLRLLKKVENGESIVGD